MINFNEVYYKSVLKEDVAWTQSLSKMIFDLPRYEFKDVKIPLSPTIFKRIWPDAIRSKAFHVTDFDGVAKLKRLQGGRKSISAFYNIDDYILTGGIKTEGGYVVELVGDVLAAAPDDMASQPDKTGRRWMTFSTLINASTASDPGLCGASKLKKMGDDLGRLLVKILKKNGEDIDAGSRDNIIGLQWSGLGKKTGGKVKSIIIKDYLDGVEKIMKKYARPLKSVLTDYTKKRALVPDPDSGETAMWDELVVNNFKISVIHVSPEYSPDFDGEDNIDGFPFQLYDDVGDMVDYINRTVANMKIK